MHREELSCLRFSAGAGLGPREEFVDDGWRARCEHPIHRERVIPDARTFDPWFGSKIPSWPDLILPPQAAQHRGNLPLGVRGSSPRMTRWGHRHDARWRSRGFGLGRRGSSAFAEDDTELVDAPKDPMHRDQPVGVRSARSCLGMTGVCRGANTPCTVNGSGGHWCAWWRPSMTGGDCDTNTPYTVSHPAHSGHRHDPKWTTKFAPHGPEMVGSRPTMTDSNSRRPHCAPSGLRRGHEMVVRLRRMKRNFETMMRLVRGAGSRHRGNSPYTLSRPRAILRNRLADSTVHLLPP